MISVDRSISIRPTIPKNNSVWCQNYTESVSDGRVSILAELCLVIYVSTIYESIKCWYSNQRTYHVIRIFLGMMFPANRRINCTIKIFDRLNVFFFFFLACCYFGFSSFAFYSYLKCAIYLIYDQIFIRRIINQVKSKQKHIDVLITSGCNSMFWLSTLISKRLLFVFLYLWLESCLQFLYFSESVSSEFSSALNVFFYSWTVPPFHSSCCFCLVDVIW